MANNCLIALGANLPTSTRTPLELLEYALKVLEDESFDLTAVSRWYKSPAFPAGSGPDYINGVAAIRTLKHANDVLRRLNEIESELGRIRKDRWGARVCDLDLLTCNQEVLPDLETYTFWRGLPLKQQMSDVPTELILPHPRIQDRPFVLIPMRDVAPDWQHPATGETIDDLIDALPPEILTEIEAAD